MPNDPRVIDPISAIRDLERKVTALGGTFRFSTGVPVSGLGKLKDFYLNLENLDWYIKSSDTEWTLQGNIGSSDKNFRHIQSVPSSAWPVNHALNKRPSVAAVDSSGEVVIGDVQYLDDNNLVIRFSGEFSGEAYCN